MNSHQKAYIILFVISIILILEVDVETIDFTAPTFELRDYEVSVKDEVTKSSLINAMVYDLYDEHTSVDDLDVTITNYDSIRTGIVGEYEVVFSVCDQANNCSEDQANLVVTRN